jgi:hypothetical protein
MPYIGNFWNKTTINGQEVELYRVEVGIYGKDSREILVTKEGRDYLVNAFETYTRDTGFNQIGYTRPVGIQTQGKTVTVEHWIGIEQRMFVIPLDHIVFLY